MIGLLAPLDRKLVRDLWRMRGQALAVAVVMAAGIAVMVSALGVIGSLRETMAAYYERQRFGDVFASLKRAPEGLRTDIAAIAGVNSVETRTVHGVVLSVPGFAEPVTGLLIGIPEHGEPALDRLTIRIGRSVAPGRPDETVLNEAFAEAHGLRPGDTLEATINGRRRTLDVVGVGLSPEHVYTVAPGALVPDKRRFGVLWLGETALAAAFDLDGAFNDVVLGLTREADPDLVVERLDALLEPYGGTGAILRKDQPSHWFLEGEIVQLGNLAQFLPPIFLAVAAFMVNMVTTRMVALEREQIGLLKAFGLGNAAVAWHYLKLVLLVAALGILPGIAAGAALGRMLTGQYADYFRFPLLYYRLDPATLSVAALAAAGAAVLGAATAVARVLRLTPAEAMRPPAPASFRPSLVERLGLVRRLDQPTRIILRSLRRYPLRAASTTLGIASGVAVLVLSLHWLDAVERLLEVGFRQEQRQDVTVSFVEPLPRRVLGELDRLPGVLWVEPRRTVAVRLRHGPRARRGILNGVPPDAELSRVLDGGGNELRVVAEGLLLSDALAERLAVGRGDRVWVEALEGRRRQHEMPVAGTFETFLGTPAYLELSALAPLLGEATRVSAADLRVAPGSEGELYRRLQDLPQVAAISLRGAMVEEFERVLDEVLLAMVAVYVAFAAMLAAGVVHASATIALSERSRELASLRVLGFTRLETSYVLFGELALLTLLALPLGCGLGWGLAVALNDAFATELYRLPLVVEAATFGFAMVAVLAAAMVTGMRLRRRLDRLDLVAAVNTRE